MTLQSNVAPHQWSIPSTLKKIIYLLELAPPQWTLWRASSSFQWLRLAHLTACPMEGNLVIDQVAPHVTLCICTCTWEFSFSLFFSLFTLHTHIYTKPKPSLSFKNCRVLGLIITFFTDEILSIWLSETSFGFLKSRAFNTYLFHNDPLRFLVEGFRSFSYSRLVLNVI